MRARKLHWALVAAAIGAFAGVEAGCKGDLGGARPGGTGAGEGHGSGGRDGSTGGDNGGGIACGTTMVTIAQRLVRLTNAQIGRSIEALLGPEATRSILPGRRVFMQLIEEGQTVDASLLRKNMTWAEAAAATVKAQFASLTGCAAATATDACVQTFLGNFGAKAYRRPMTSDELASLMTVYTATRTGGTPEEGVGYAIEALLTSPAFLYRTEFGNGTGGAGKEARLTADEMASLLSYVLLDGPPDEALRAAARSGALATDAGVAAEVGRLLSVAGGPAQTNMVEAVKAFFTLDLIDSVPKDGALATALHTDLRNAMYTETELFLRDTLWKGDVDDLLTPRATFVNRDLAAFYGIAWPGAADAPLDQFLPAQAPPQRAGVLTHGSILASQARTDNTSVVARGLFIDGRILCSTRPPDPPAGLTNPVQMLLMDPTRNEREKAEYRAAQDSCKGCHAAFDAYGLVLESFDAIGRYRSSYADGKPIDPSGMLPAALGGAHVADAADLVTKVADSGAFSLCMAVNMTRYALTQATGGLDRSEATVCNLSKRLSAPGGDGTFTALMREILTSRTVTTRAVGGAI